MDKGAWQATVHGVEKSRTQLSDSRRRNLDTETDTLEGEDGVKTQEKLVVY